MILVRGLFDFSFKFALNFGMRMWFDDELYEHDIYGKKYGESEGKKLEINWNRLKFYLILLSIMLKWCYEINLKFLK